MGNEYQYGAYGQLAQTVVKSAEQTSTIPVYVGTAPVNLVRGYAESGTVNMPVRLSNMADAQRKIGYSADWEGFTLCEALSAHFNNPLGNIGPIYVINALDPAVHVRAEKTTKSLNFSAGRSAFMSGAIILDTLALADKVEGVDFSVEYNFTKGTVVIASLNADDPLTGTVIASYSEADPAMVAAEDIVGEVTAEGSYAGLGAVSLVYTELNAIPNLIAAPGWSHIPGVYEAMVDTAKSINGHWDAFVLADIPLKDGGDAVDTKAKALVWKAENGYAEDCSKVCWPRVTDSAGRNYHLSTMAVVEFMRIDTTHSGIPMETCANKPIPILRQYFGEGSTNRGFDQQMANDLTGKGVTTAVKWGGQWVLWGDHTAAYDFEADGDPRAIFDVSMRMLMYITNDFQREWSPEIDRPMSRALKDRIINREQEKLDMLVAVGALIGQPVIVFEETENTTAELMSGRFRWDLAVTPTPPTKSVSVYVAYTSDGFASYFEGGV